MIRILLVAALVPGIALPQNWVLQSSGVTVSLRGVHAVNKKAIWASGSEGTWLRSVDGGAHWTSGKVAGGETLDFRAIQAFSADEAILMSSGEGSLSKIFATRDGGVTWHLLFENPDAKGFFDGLAFDSRSHGALLGDPVNGRFSLFVTHDGGRNWVRREGPLANPDEASFAASNSTVRLHAGAIWVASGGRGGARIFRSMDDGKSWHVAQTPVRHDAETAGIFGLGWRGRNGVAVGGDYRRDQENRQNVAVTRDGGKTWTGPVGPAGFRSSVEWVPTLKLWIAIGTSGSDSSADGLAWHQFDSSAWNALSGIWAVGPKGAIAKLTR
jgi:photosystem II stability/assembly factor-like uncharacterized protein